MSGKRGYAIGPGWRGLLTQVGVDSTHMLRRAGLPDDLLSREDVHLGAAELFRFNEALDASAPDSGLWLQVADAMSPEWFTPPVFAALCSPNLLAASHRLALFKPLIAPATLEVRDRPDRLDLTIRWTSGDLRPPRCMHVLEALFIAKLARLGTRIDVRPMEVLLPELPVGTERYEDYLGVRLQRGDLIRVSFTAADARSPFLTLSDAMWGIFEPDLRARLDQLRADATFTERAQAVLVEALPGGQVGMERVARRLGVSNRTLQRRLHEEGTTFTDLVNAIRHRLARHYLQQRHISLTEIAYLLGFEEATSFFRAFYRWTGTTPEAARRKMRAD